MQLARDKDLKQARKLRKIPKDARNPAQNALMDKMQPQVYQGPLLALPALLCCARSGDPPISGGLGEREGGGRGRERRAEGGGGGGMECRRQGGSGLSAHYTAEAPEV